MDMGESNHARGGSMVCGYLMETPLMIEAVLDLL